MPSPGTPDQRDLVVLSHLRWDWVWQRPQHLVSRLARGRRTWFVEEPRVADVAAPRIAVQEAGPVIRVWLDVPDDGEIPEYGVPAAKGYADLLAAHLGTGHCDAWLYTATALPLAEALEPRLLVYDVMDDLGAFADAPPHFEELYRRALDTADLVFTGGRSLYAAAVQLAGPEKTYRFSSGVEIAHYASSRSLRSGDGPPVAGYVGVVDERLDLALLADLAAVLADWGDVVHLAETAAEFAAGCREVREDSVRHRDRQVAPLAARYEWDTIAAQMQALMDDAVHAAGVVA